jgi:hypothetical protein
MSDISLADFTPALFRPHIGGTFVFERREGGAASMKLLEVTTRPGSDDRPFAMLFVLAEGPPLEFGSPRLIREGFEPCEIFFSRVRSPRHEANDPAGIYYEAVFG